MNLTIIRHASLVPPYDNYEKMDYKLLAGLSRREINPGIDIMSNIEMAQKVREEIVSPDFIITSEALRTQASARLIFGENISYIIKKELNEIPFCLENICPEEEFMKTGMTGIRKSFFESIADRTSIENLVSIQTRISNLEKYLKNLHGKNIIMISHGWLMRFLYAHFVLRRDMNEVSVDEYLSYPIFDHLEKFSCNIIN